MKGKQPAKRGLALALAGTLLASTVVGAGFPVAQAADNEFNYVDNGTLTAKSTAAPAPDTVLPNANQYWYQKAELSAFCHFGPNTFNEIEWGEHYGDKTPDEIFKLETDFDADTMVKTLKDAGFKMLIVTAKHHDGFCIWASEHTTYDVASTSYKNGQGDILAELSAACTEYNMDMGLYLSPWDIHDPSYGYYKDENKQQPTTNKEEDLLDYNDYYNNQLEEILGNDKYGNDGHFREVWMDGAKGSGANAQEYDFERWFATIQKYEGKDSGAYGADCMLFGAQAYTTVRWIGNENGYAADDTWSKSTVNYGNNTIDSGSQGGYTVGKENGNQWTVPECDARITSGWFWGTQKKTPKTIEALAEMYFRSVGHNSTFLLNVPPNNQGTVDQAILDRVTEFGENVTQTFDYNLAKTVQATNVRGNDTAFSPMTTIDGKDETYWTTADGTNEATLLIDLDGVKSFDVVSVEEAIQNGQRINQYKVEYKDASGQWQTLESGETIGAKRLVRTGAVRGDQVRITVSTPEDKVPMISEVGVYKASEGFELPGAAPVGMNVIDISDANAFRFGTGWTSETGSQFVGGTNKYANKGSSLTLTFTGTKVYLIGTKDPNHGTATVSIDGGEPVTIDTNATSRALGQVIFTSKDLTDGTHTLTLNVTNKAIGIEAAYTINNGGKGMVGIEQSRYTMNEDETMEVKLVRVGGANESVTVTLTPNPGSAIQDDFNTELIETVTFGPGETEKTAQVQTRRNTNVTGDQYFTIELSCADPAVILGFEDAATITIKDTETAAREDLVALVEEELLAEWYTQGWEPYAQAVESGKELLKQSDATVDEMVAAKQAIEDAKADLVERDGYTAQDPVPFPWQPDSSYTLEAEFAQLNNTGDNERWPLQVAKADWASHGEFINCLNNGDSISFPYVADRTGTYTVTASYRSGDPNNSLAWSESTNKITSGTVSAGANDKATATHTVTFDIEVTEAGAGTLVFTGPAKNSPQLDKLVITPKEITYEKHDVTIVSGNGGSVTSDLEGDQITDCQDVVLTISPDAGYHLKSLTVNGQAVTVTGNTYTVANVTEDVNVKAEFEKHTTKLEGKVDATCTTDGYTGDLVCTVCGTVVEEGETIKATGHNYVDGVCTVCGAQDPNYVPPTENPDPDPSTPVDPEPSTPVDPQPSAPVTGGGVTVDNNSGTQVTVGNADKVFEANTVITVESVTQGKIYDTVKEALKDVVADMKNTAILDITATLDGKPVQPDGKVQMTFAIPENLSVDNLKLFYVSDDGKTTEEIAITVNKDARTVTANLEHFSTYVLANVVADKTDSGVPGTGDNSQLMLYVAALAISVMLMSATVVVSRKRRG